MSSERVRVFDSGCSISGTFHLNALSDVNSLYTKEAHQKKHIIHIFSRFFIHDGNQRRDEIKFCLNNNNSNVDITKIHLLNERIYTDDEMGVENSSKIIQTDIKYRIKFKDVFSYIRSNNIQGYLVFVNMAPSPSKVLSDHPHSLPSAVNWALLDSTLSSYPNSGARRSSHSPSSALVATPVSRTLVSSPLETSVCSVSTPSSLPHC